MFNSNGIQTGHYTFILVVFVQDVQMNIQGLVYGYVCVCVESVRGAVVA